MLFDLIKSALMGMIQGIAEWLPISSGGHLMLFNALLPFTNKQQMTFTGKTKIEIHKKDVIVLAAMTLASALFIVLYYWYSWKVLGKPLPWNAEV